MTESVTCPQCAGDGKAIARLESGDACSRCAGKGRIESDCYDWADDQIEEWALADMLDEDYGVGD